MRLTTYFTYFIYFFINILFFAEHMNDEIEITKGERGGGGGGGGRGGGR